nr:P2X purinoceptor 7-like [Crassostrea gigas]
MRETLIRVAEENPEYLFAMLGSSNKEPQQPKGPMPSQSQPSWCVCTFCNEMLTQRERLCCQKDPESCISRLSDFRVLLLDEAVLAVARLYRQDILAMPEDEDRDRANRHTAYRQFVLWHYGRLGAGDGRVIPNCCLTHQRKISRPNWSLCWV